MGVSNVSTIRTGAFGDGTVVVGGGGAVAIGCVVTFGAVVVGAPVGATAWVVVGLGRNTGTGLLATTWTAATLEARGCAFRRTAWCTLAACRFATCRGAGAATTVEGVRCSWDDDGADAALGFDGGSRTDARTPAPVASTAS